MPSQDADIALAEQKFKELDGEGKDVLQGASLPQLADWVWSHFYPGGAALTPQERDKLVAKLLPRQQKSGAEPALSLKDFLKWFVSVRDRVPKEEQKRTPPATPSGSQNGSTQNRALDISATFPTQATPSPATPTPTPTGNFVSPTVLSPPIITEVPDDDDSLRGQIRVLTDTLVDMQSRVHPTTVAGDDPTLTALANSLEAERLRNGKLIRIQKRLQDDLARAEEGVSRSQAAEVHAMVAEGEVKLAESERKLVESERKLEESKVALQKALLGEQQARAEAMVLQDEVDALKAGESKKSLEDEIAFHKERNKSLEASLASMRQQQANAASSSAQEEKLRNENRQLQSKVSKLEEESMAALRAAELSTQMVDTLQQQVSKAEEREAGSNTQQLRREIMRLESAVAEWKQRAADLEDEVVSERALRRLQADLQLKQELAEERAERAEAALVESEQKAILAETEAKEVRVELARVKTVADTAETKKRALVTTLESQEARLQQLQLEAEQETAARELLTSQLRQARNQVEEAQKQLLLSDADTLAKEDAVAEALAKQQVANQQLVEARKREEELQRSLREAYDDLEREKLGREEALYAAEKKEAALESKIKEVVMASFQAKQDAQKQLDYGSKIAAELQSVRKAAPHTPPPPEPEQAETKRAVKAEAPLARAAPPAPAPTVLNLPPSSSVSTAYRPAGISKPGYSGPKQVTSPGGYAALALNTAELRSAPVRKVVEASDVDVTRDVSPARHRWVNSTTVV